MDGHWVKKQKIEFIVIYKYKKTSNARLFETLILISSGQFLEEKFLINFRLRYFETLIVIGWG